MSPKAPKTVGPGTWCGAAVAIRAGRLVTSSCLQAELEATKNSLSKKKEQSYCRR